MLCFLILSFVCGKQSTGWWSTCDGRTDVRLEFWNVLKRNIPGLLSCFQAVSSYLRLCYSAGAQKARRPHEKQIGFLFIKMYIYIYCLKYIDFFSICSVHWILSGQAFWELKASETNANISGVPWCRFARFTFHVSISGEKSFPNHHSQSTYVLQETESPQRRLGHVQSCHKFIHFLNQTWTKCE